MKIISSNEMINALDKNCTALGFRKVKIPPLRNVIEADGKGAYLFAETTGTYYLTNKKEKIHPDLRKVPLTTPLEMLRKHPCIFTKKKYIVPFDWLNYSDQKTEKMRKEEKFNELLDEIKESNLNFDDFIIMPVCTSLKTGSKISCEPFFEFLVCNFFRNDGYLVENQLQSTDKGIPDGGAYLIPELQNQLIERKFICYGAFLSELSLIRIFGKVNAKKGVKIKKTDNEVIGFEAKTQTRVGTPQLNKYWKNYCFNEIYEVAPFTRGTKNGYGLITLDDHDFSLRKEQGKLYFAPDKEIYLKKVEKLIKWYLLMNLFSSNSEIKKMIDLSFDKILDKIEDTL